MSTDVSLASSSDRPAIRKRWLLLSLLAAIGALAYVPALGAMGMPVGPTFALLLTLGAGVICGCIAWLGLRWADAAGLPMPWLRQLDAGRAMPRPLLSATALALAGGLVLGLIAIGTLRGFGLANMPGTLAARLSSTLFAAITLEIIIHLGLMSGLVAWSRSRWTGILAAALLFVVFHLGGVGQQPAAILLSVMIFNGAAGVFFGWLYARFGFEYLILAHATAHALAVGFG